LFFSFSCVSCTYLYCETRSKSFGFIVSLFPCSLKMPLKKNCPSFKMENPQEEIKRTYISPYWKLFSPLKASSSKSSCCEALRLMSCINCCSFWSNGSNGAKQIYISLFCPDNFRIF